MKYCSNCGRRLEWIIPEHDDRPRHVCPRCGTIHYQNPKMVVGCIPEWQDKILLCRRNIEPKKGLWTLPAEYLENGETAEEGARRETREETGAAVITLQPYLMYDIVHIHQIYLMFRSRLQAPDFHVTPESSEVQLFSQDQIPWDEIAFRVIEKTLKTYFTDRQSGNFSFTLQQINAPEIR